ncbi:MAG: transporter [Pyrinomonadaceae bacterium]
MRNIYRHQLLLLLLTLFAPLGAVTSAQEIEPRAYARAPVGTQYVVVSYAYSSGDVLTDASLPLRDVEVKFGAAALAYGRTFGLKGRQANVGVLVPYVKGRVSGLVFEQQREVTRSGLGDARLRFSTNLSGGPALSPKEFAAFKPRTLVGVSLTVVAPTGQYDPRRLVNLGSNRWAFKPEVGVSKPFGRWTAEMAGGAWLFTPNNNFFGGARREQRPLASLQAHLVYTFRPRMWLAAGATYYKGGRTVVDGDAKADAQNNSRFGTTFSYPLGRRQSLKAAYARGLTARFGGHLSSVGVGWQYAW